MQVVSVEEVETEQGMLRRLRVRYSWGGKDGMCKGRWSDDSDAWVDCPAAFNAGKFKRTNERTFWISYSHFLKYCELARLNINLAAMTMEQVISKRRNMMADMCANLNLECGRI